MRTIAKGHSGRSGSHGGAAQNPSISLIRVTNMQNFENPQPYNDGAMKAFALTELSCGSAKLHGTERFQRLRVNA